MPIPRQSTRDIPLEQLRQQEYINENLEEANVYLDSMNDTINTTLINKLDDIKSVLDNILIALTP